MADGDNKDWENVVEAQEAQDTKAKLQKQLDDALEQNRQLMQKNVTLETEKNDTLADLATVTAQLDDQKALTRDLLQQLDKDIAAEAEAKKKKVMVIMDEVRATIRPYLSDTHKWTLCTIANTTDEVRHLIDDKSHLHEIKSHDMVILSCGRSQIIDGETGRAVAESIKKLAQYLADVTGLDICVLPIPPTRASPGQALLCNMRLKDMLADITGVKLISLDKLTCLDKSNTLTDDNVLTPAGGKTLADIVNSITVAGTRRMIKASNDCPEDEDKENKKEEKGVKGGSKNEKKKNESSDSSDSDTSEDEMEEEIIQIKHDLIGPIIGKDGGKIQSLRAKTGAMISVLDTQPMGLKRSKVTIKGKRGPVQAACFEINRIINRVYRQKPVGNSPKPKKSKN